MLVDSSGSMNPADSPRAMQLPIQKRLRWPVAKRITRGSASASPCSPANKVAIASLEMMDQRVKRRKEIDYWISGYDGEDLKSGEFRCVTPRIPAMSKINADIDRIGAAINTWQDCYNKYVTNLNAASPLTKRVPEDIRKLMKKDELEKSNTHLEQLQANLSEEAKVSSKLILADFEAWRKATEAYVSEHNKMVKTNSSTLFKDK